MTEKNYYLLELDDAVIALENKDIQIKCLEDENKELKRLLKELFKTADLAYCEDDLLKTIEELLDNDTKNI